MPRHVDTTRNHRAALAFCIAAAALFLVALAGEPADKVSAASANPKNPRYLPIGDGKVTTTGPRRGYVYRCGSGPGGGGAGVDGPWIRGDGTYDLTAKATVDGSVRWNAARFSASRSGNRRSLSGNGLPTSHTTGIYPIQPSDDAYQYDRNPNSISAQSLAYSLPARPRRAASASCLTAGPIGITRSGVVIFDGLDAQERDAVAHEVQDRCGGHPQMSGIYHYHSIPSCLTRGQSKRKHSGRVGFALDGFPIHGPRGTGGKVLTNQNLDACHGHTHKITLDGRRVRFYHYHATLEYPYTLGCFRGTPATG